MSSLPEIEAAAAELQPEQQQELLLFLASRLRGHAIRLPEPRNFSSDQVSAFLVEDEADMAAFRAEKK